MEEEKKIIDSKIIEYIDSKIIDSEKIIDSKIIEYIEEDTMSIIGTAKTISIFFICSFLVEKYILPKLDLNILEESLVIISSTIISRKIF